MPRLARGRASRTARVTAAMRHRHHVAGLRPLVFDDTHARLFLDIGTALFAAPTPLSDWLMGKVLGPVRALEGEVLARSRYVEEVLEAMLAGGLRQMLILGAGFDTTAMRHAGSGCRFFEVDHPATQAEKQAILAKHPEIAHDTAFVPVDFAHDDLAIALDQAGFDASARTLISWLGVTMYLSRASVLKTLKDVRGRVAAGSILIFDAFPRKGALAGEDRALFAATRAFTAATGEPMTEWFDPETVSRLVAESGWNLAELIQGAEMRERWFAGQPQAILPPRGVAFCKLTAI